VLFPPISLDRPFIMMLLFRPAGTTPQLIVSAFVETLMVLNRYVPFFNTIESKQKLNHAGSCM
jgi:hypothetical protein